MILLLFGAIGAPGAAVFAVLIDLGPSVRAERSRPREFLVVLPAGAVEADVLGEQATDEGGHRLAVG